VSTLLLELVVPGVLALDVLGVGVLAALLVVPLEVPDCDVDPFCVAAAESPAVWVTAATSAVVMTPAAATVPYPAIASRRRRPLGAGSFLMAPTIASAGSDLCQPAVKPVLSCAGNWIRGHRSRA
jgi:hypothetical protein